MPGTLTKADLISAIQTENGYSLTRASDIIETPFEIIKRAVESGGDLMISGFGKFQVKDKQVPKGRNPATGDDMILPTRRVVTFKSAGRLRERIKVLDDIFSYKYGAFSKLLSSRYRIAIRYPSMP